MSYVTLNRSPAVSDEVQYRLLRMAIFPLFLTTAVLSRLWRIGRADGSDVPRSILAEARTASASALLFAFQG